jgi:hypothetical protein
LKDRNPLQLAAAFTSTTLPRLKALNFLNLLAATLTLAASPQLKNKN